MKESKNAIILKEILIIEFLLQHIQVLSSNKIKKMINMILQLVNRNLIITIHYLIFT